MAYIYSDSVSQTKQTYPNEPQPMHAPTKQRLNIILPVRDALFITFLQKFRNYTLYNYKPSGFYRYQSVTPLIIVSSQLQMNAQGPQNKTVKSLLAKIQNSFQQQHSDQLTSLFRQLYNDPAYNNTADSWKLSINEQKYSKYALGSQFARVLESIKVFQYEKLKKGVNIAFKLHIDTLSAVLKLLDEIKDEESMWLCKPLRQIIRNTKKIFFSAVKRQQQTGGAITVKKDDPIIKMQQFKTRKTLHESIRKQIVPLIDNMQVSIMLVYHNYDQIKRILNNVKPYGEHGPEFIDNYLFQKGKTAMIYEQFLEAEECLQKIKIKTIGQKRLVLKYLIPCKMFLGKNFIPNPNNPQELFPQYEPIVKALNRAKFNDYNEAIQKYQKLWIKRGIYVLMDKLRIILWRNLIKKVHEIMGDYKLDIEKIYKAVQLSGGDQKIEECICVISNLIYQGKIKGYIYQNEEQKVLVLKKDGDGFPSLSKC